MKSNIDIPLNRLVISLGLMFLLGVMFAVINGFYVEQSGETLPFIVYVVALISLILGASLILIFQTRISKIQLENILNILPADEREIIKVLIENNYRLEQNHIVAYTGYNKVRVSRILTKYEQKNIVEKRNVGNTNLVILKLR